MTGRTLEESNLELTAFKLSSKRRPFNSYSLFTINLIAYYLHL
uniref:Uncharacterized protein n=1 Tax=Heterorhabditis bacteriophora TaxID=37862 RepID=A0A1I7XVS4_HETBA